MFFSCYSDDVLVGSINSFFSLLNGQNPLTHHSARMFTGHSRIRAAKLHFFSHLEHILCLIFKVVVLMLVIINMICFGFLLGYNPFGMVLADLR